MISPKEKLQKHRKHRKHYTYDDVLWLLSDYGNMCMAELAEHEFGSLATVKKYINEDMWLDKREDWNS